MRQLQPLPALLVALLASLLSDLLWFEIGRRRGGTVLRLLCRLSLEADPVVIPGALRLDPEELEAGHPAIPREREIVLYCT
jgi:membrane protein DedA with SNARE-associated domain